MGISRVRKAALAIIMLGMGLVASACSMRSAPADLLLPIHGADEELTKAVRQSLPANASLALVDREQQLRAIRQADLDGDGQLEAVVTYKDDSEQSKVLLLHKDKASGRWGGWATIEENSSFGIDWLELSDLNHDGAPELLVGFNSYELNQRTLYIYNAHQSGTKAGGVLKPTAELAYSLIEDGDLDGDGRKELVIVQQDSEKMEASLAVYRMEPSGLKRIAAAPADGGVNGYFDMRIGKVSSGHRGVMLQASLGAHTEAVYMYAWDEAAEGHAGGKTVQGGQAGQLRQVYPNEAISQNSDIVETYFLSVTGGDGNGDGILDFAAERTAPGQPEDTPYSNMITFQDYLQWDGKGAFPVVQRMYENFGMGVMLRIPEQWGNHFTIANLDGPSRDMGIQIQMYEPQSGTRARLFDLLAIPAAHWEEAKDGLEKDGQAYARLLAASGMVYIAVYGMPPESWGQREKDAFQAMLLDENELSQRLQVMERP
ncbi:FG-GAP repeat domain-containing protein [Paenibacillus sp. MMS18-CY102]|uniref:FG-GAP repeat domain-containing protein n=1 Tax=Paenibacillus sp. MMS18-CY102 TaxID=2682849 RepID=UPI001365A251|nr:VCBS repeat-containing protein [Paenibacillus sp. MMS18-CY102]MWC31106.1 hypothetical protein [Paenibacillus sp. MMS18-CY102]